MKLPLTLSVLLLVVWSAGRCEAAGEVSVPRGGGDGVSENDIRFVVMPDRTGGMRSGVFHEGLRKANLLHPEFLISVGDLIDGYTHDRTLLDAQWKEFDAMVDELDMPFYYVPGNHDISNEWMEEEWKRRLGDPYYYFVYKNVLFIALHTEDGGKSGISEEQGRFFQQVLAEHADVRWTFLFMHRPLWSYEDEQGFERIRAGLEGRKFTLISGHHHNSYYESDANGNEWLTLGTAGGGSQLRGEAFGEFDHVTHVAMTDAGPKITHLKLDGFVAKDVVNKENGGRVEALRQGGFARIHSVVAESKVVSKLNGSLQFRNEEAFPLRCRIAFPEMDGLAFSASREGIEVLAGESLEVGFSVRGVDGREVDLSDLEPIYLTVTGTYPLEGGREISLPVRLPWRIDWPHVVNAESDWEQLDPPGYFEEGWDWRGAEDCSIRFRWLDRGDTLALEVEARDERLILEGEALSDRFTLYLENGDKRNVWEFVPREGGTLELPESFVGRAKCEVEKWGLRLYVEVAKELLFSDLDTNAFRFNLKYLDHDRPENLKPSRLFWKPDWDRGLDTEDFGTFVLE